MRIVLTGATGFVGGRVARAARDRGDEVVALVRTPSAALADLGVDQREVSLLDLEAVQAAAADADAIVHAAATADPEKAEEVNVHATRAVAGAALLSGVRLVHVSTTSVYDRDAGGTGEVGEDHRLVTRDSEAPLASSSGAAYATTKAAGELEIERAVDNGLVAAVLRPPAVLGAGPTSTWGTRVPSRIRDGDGPAIAPGNTFGFVHVDDLVDAVLATVVADAEVVRGLVTNVVGGHVPFGTYRDAVVAIVDGPTDTPEPEGPVWTGRYATDRLPASLPVRPHGDFDAAMDEIAASWREGDPRA